MLFNELPLAVIRSLIREYLFNHFGLLIMTLRSFPINILINVLILERFTDNILSKFTYLSKRGGKELTLFFKKGWTLPREG